MKEDYSDINGKNIIVILKRVIKLEEKLKELEATIENIGKTTSELNSRTIGSFRMK